MASTYTDEKDEPTDVKWMARLSERDEVKEKRLRLQLSECFKKKLVIVEHQAGRVNICTS